MRLRLLLILAVLATPMGLWAKRVSPKPVSPVVYAGVTYSLAGDGREGYAVATETSTGKELWKVRVFVCFVFGFCENIFIAPNWWEGLPAKDQEALRLRMQNEASIDLAPSESCLKDDGLRLVDWEISSVQIAV
jgi:hypothetical protein